MRFLTLYSYTNHISSGCRFFFIFFLIPKCITPRKRRISFRIRAADDPVATTVLTAADSLYQYASLPPHQSPPFDFYRGGTTFHDDEFLLLLSRPPSPVRRFIFFFPFVLAGGKKIITKKILAPCCETRSPSRARRNGSRSQLIVRTLYETGDSDVVGGNGVENRKFAVTYPRSARRKKN